MLCLKLLVIFSVTFCGAHGQAVKPTYGLVFAGPTASPPTTAKPTTCRCVAVGSCPTAPAFDVRIVNTGCSSGTIWCCELPDDNSSTSVKCGTRRVKNAPEPKPGLARYGDHPWQVALLLPNRTYFGSGVLISPNHVLTAAHKIQSPNMEMLVRLGAWNSSALVETYPWMDYIAVKISIHPNYNSQNLQNDVAVIKISGKAPISTNLNINTACLPTDAPTVGARCYVAGWGKDSFSGKYQGVLKDVDVPIIDQKSCETLLRTTRLGSYFNLDKNSFICAGGERQKDSCTGDGGAPLVCKSNDRWYVYGLSAWGIGCADDKIPAVYVNVYNYLTWINQQI